MLMASCGRSYKEEQELARAESIRLAKEDSAALKIGIIPTLDCLPLMVAKELCLFDSTGSDIRLKAFTSQLDCDDALMKGKIEGSVTDVVKAEWMKRKGFQLHYFSGTNAAWKLITNRMARISEMKQMSDKMVAMARFSATHLLAEMCTDSAKLKRDNVFLVQINDPNVCLKMLKNNEMDAMILPEPQATTAVIWKNPVMMDTQSKDIRLGCIVFEETSTLSQARRRQLADFTKAYNAAVDSINKHGIKNYADIIADYTKADKATIDRLPKTTFTHAAPPREKDLNMARRWLK